jgi:predicted metal-dependent peptidase
MIDQSMRLKKAHVSLMKHPETALYSGIMMMGKSEVIDDDVTAYTDGVNKKYGSKFISKLTDQELNALVLHENLHIALKHLHRFNKEFRANPQLTNASADYVVNDVIVNLADKNLCKLPEGGLYDEMFHNWSVRQVYDYLSKMQKEQQDKDSMGGNSPSSQGKNKGTSIKLSDGTEISLDTLDEHDFDNAQQLTPEQSKELSTKIDRALREGGILAGRLGAKIPRTIEELLEPKIDWKEVLKEFITSATRGNDEYTWRKFNKRLVANDYYLPSMENDTIGEIVVAIDTSGSIGSKELTEFASELASICQVCTPNKVRVLWWDTEVHGEQIFEDNFSNIAGLLKPQGGGGTHISCVSEYINKNKIVTDAVLIFTDGYVENDIKWDISSPTLWLVTENRSFTPPTGKVVRKD